MISQNRGGLRSSSPIWSRSGRRHSTIRSGWFPARRHRGDEPWRGVRPTSEQCGDLRTVLPRGELVGFAANRAHWVDIGGHAARLRLQRHHGNLRRRFAAPLAQDLRSGKAQRNRFGRSCATNIRFPDASLGDLRAQVAACQMGAQRYAELLSRYGRETVEDCVAVVWDQAEAAARRVVEAIPDGEYEAESFLDNDGPQSQCPIADQGQQSSSRARP